MNLDEANTIPHWAPRGLPGRLTLEHAGKVLGFTPFEIRALVREKHIKILGTPSNHQTKYIATVRVMKVVDDEAWLQKATSIAYKANQTKNSKASHQDERLAA